MEKKDFYPDDKIYIIMKKSQEPMISSAVTTKKDIWRPTRILKRKNSIWREAEIGDFIIEATVSDVSEAMMVLKSEYR